ncbi:MAG: hypothetical protein OXM01_12715 [Gemmatimonadota bacterium]|nr:hypothetical protein [Gemmatimonadota bacterium]
MKKLGLGLLARAARLVGLRAEATPPRNHARSGLFAAVHRNGSRGLVCSLCPIQPDAEMAFRISSHFEHMLGRAARDTLATAESSQALLAWVVLAKVLASHPEGARILAEVKDGFAVGGTDDEQQQEARAILARELAILKNMVTLAKGGD